MRTCNRYRNAIRASVSRFAATGSAELNRLRLNLLALAAYHAISEPATVTRSDAADKFSATLAIIRHSSLFADKPTASRLRLALGSIAAFNHIVIKQADALAPRLLSQTAELPERPAFTPRYVPHGELDWQTQPVIGSDPRDVAAEMQRTKFQPRPRNTALPSTAGVFPKITAHTPRITPEIAARLDAAAAKLNH